MQKKNRGIIALLPAIIISSTLIILCFDASSYFLASLCRNTALEDKAQGTITAHLCVLRVLAKHLQDDQYGGGETVFVEGVPCTVGALSNKAGRVSVTLGEAVTVENFTY